MVFNCVLHRRIGMIMLGVALAVVFWSLIDPFSLAAHRLVMDTAKVLVIIGILQLIVLIPIEHCKADMDKVIHTLAEAVPTIVVPSLLVAIPYRLYYASISRDEYTTRPIIDSLYEGMILGIGVTIAFVVLIIIGRVLGAIKSE